jgi:hypothetical protein
VINLPALLALVPLQILEAGNVREEGVTPGF